MAGAEGARRAVREEGRAGAGPGHTWPRVEVRTLTFILSEAGS